MMRPSNDLYFIRPCKLVEMTKGGIHLPENRNRDFKEGVIVAAGPGKRLPDGTRAGMDYSAGDKVLFSIQMIGTVEIGGEPLVFCHEEGILACDKADVVAQ